MTTSSPELLDPARFEGAVEGRPVRLLPLSLPHGLRAAVCNHGARLLQLVAPGRDGGWHDVVLGHDSLPQLLTGMASMGAFIGRYANRIAQARFALGGRSWALPANDGPHCLHGGPGGSRHQVFDVLEEAPDRVTLGWRFCQAQDGFPGDLDLRVTYALRAPCTLAITWEARALEQDTVASFAPHPFFNLEGHDAQDARGQFLRIEAGHWLPVGGDKIPTGQIAPVDGTAMDLRQERTLGDALSRLPAGSGFDHCYVPPGAGTLRRVASARAPGTGITLAVWTDQPGLQFFSSSGFDGSAPRHAGKGGRLYTREAGFCLEPQGLPDAPNQPGFPATVLRAGESARGVIEYRFGVDGREG